jgi:prepilin-type N-terminal cleavage/methylation domain-containing protein
MAPSLRGTRHAFSLIEVLIVVAVIGIMGALIITSITNAASDSRMVLARQQQAVLQNALNAWISAATSGTGSLAEAQSAYNAAGDKLSLVQDYLQAGTYEHFREYSSG